MSLINEMLHDLDSTRSKQDKSTAADPLLSDSSLLSSNSSSTWVPGIIAFALVASLLLFQQFNVSKESVPAETQLALNESAEVDNIAEKRANAAPDTTLLAPNYYPKLIHSMAVKSEVADVNLGSVETSTRANEQQSKSIAEARERKISELLAAASKAFAMDRLLSPADDNACDRYREILTLQPNHPQAIAGLESAANRYINLALDYAAQGNVLRAKVLLRRAEAVMPESALVRGSIEQARQQLMATNNQKEVQLAPLQKEAPLIQHQAKQELETQTIQQPPTDNNNFVRSSSDEWRDLNAARKAKRLLSKGRNDDALVVLKDFLAGSPESKYSLDLLLHTLIEKGRISEAQRYLLAAQHLTRSDVVEYNAHILVAADNVSEAIVLLESQLDKARDDYSYQVLLAGLYHRDGSYIDSVEAYTRLLREHEKKSEYWLGLAVSLDSLNRDDDALKAFISAKDATQNVQVQRYIAARIQALTNKASDSSKLQSQGSEVPS